MRVNREYVRSAFARYVSNYNAEDPKIKLKIDHTYRVAGLCETIAADLCKAEKAAGSDKAPDPDLAWLTGMLHDIGRFEQVRRYNTFSDALSVDHAEFGGDLLFKEGLLSSFIPDYQRAVESNPDADIDPETNMDIDKNIDTDTNTDLDLTEADLRILELSIRNHSRYRLQEGLTAEEEQYCHILRDADKIDIFRVNCDTPMEDIYNVSTEELKTASVSEEVKQCFRNRTAVLRPLKKTPVDHLVGHICLIFELKYPISRKIALEQGYWSKLLAFHSDNPETQAWFDYMNKTHL